MKKGTTQLQLLACLSAPILCVQLTQYPMLSCRHSCLARCYLKDWQSALVSVYVLGCFSVQTCMCPTASFRLL